MYRKNGRGKMERWQTVLHWIRRKGIRRKKGSLTVEASLVVPMCVMVLALLLSLTFYVYLRCWYTQTACEAAVQGSGYGVLDGRSGQERAEKKWKTRRRESGFSGQSVTGEVTGSGKEVQVKLSGKVSVWGRQNLIFEVGVRQKIIRPVTFVRKVTAFRS